LFDVGNNALTSGVGDAGLPPDVTAEKGDFYEQ